MFGFYDSIRESEVSQKMNNVQAVQKHVERRFQLCTEDSNFENVLRKSHKNFFVEVSIYCVAHDISCGPFCMKTAV